MLESKKELTNEHTFGSRPSWWPLMRRGVAYWIAKDNNVSFSKVILFIYLFFIFWRGWEGERGACGGFNWICDLINLS